eukprot:1160808-Pelagomonas_calceolata.AAC.6
MGFSGDGKRLVVVTGDNRHTVYVYHWRSKHLIYSNVGHNGQPPQLHHDLPNAAHQFWKSAHLGSRTHFLG